MLCRLSSSFTDGAKWTLLNDGGGGNTGTLLRSVATLLLLGTLPTVSSEPESDVTAMSPTVVTSDTVAVATPEAPDPTKLFLNQQSDLETQLSKNVDSA